MKRIVLAAALVGLTACNAHPVTKYVPNTIVEFQIPTPIEPSEKLDILWVIDNSGSMCQEQAVLRANFDRFIERLDDSIVDFHVGVTTTHMRDDFPLEPVARPGHLQSTPQPLPGFDRSCWTATNDRGESVDGDYTPIRQLMAAAVGCMQTPDETLLEVSDADIACALSCQTVAQCQPDECGGLQLFPDPAEYRALPKVLEADSYRNNDGSLRVDELKADFACMSMVGMRGYGFEKGLGAVVEAVSPELTGGTSDNPMDPSAPNFGFVRNDAQFAVVFVTDENDCTHDGSLSESQGRCGGDLCEYWNQPQLADSPLLAPDLLRDAMLSNLRATKDEAAFDVGSTLVASIHGVARRYEGDVRPTEECRVDSPTQQSACASFEACESPDYQPLPPSCASKLGSAYTGDRYERFLRSFGEGRYFPAANPQSPEDPLTGWMCSGDFAPALSTIAEFFRAPPQGCITQPIQSCEPGGSACPDHVTGEPGQCLGRPNSAEFFCDSYVQLRVAADAVRLEELQSSGFCAGGASTGHCVVSPAKYGLDACSGDISGVRVSWLDREAAQRELAGTELELRWVGY